MEECGANLQVALLVPQQLYPPTNPKERDLQIAAAD
jgi:hypothetical protein